MILYMTLVISCGTKVYATADSIVSAWIGLISAVHNYYIYVKNPVLLCALDMYVYMYISMVLWVYQLWFALNEIH